MIKINSNNNVSLDYYKTKHKVTDKPSCIISDSVEISKDAQMLSEVSSDICLDKVNKIKSLIKNGNYNISSYDIAEKILKDLELYNKFKCQR